MRQFNDLYTLGYEASSNFCLPLLTFGHSVCPQKLPVAHRNNATGGQFIARLDLPISGVESPANRETNYTNPTKFVAVVPVAFTRATAKPLMLWPS